MAKYHNISSDYLCYKKVQSVIPSLLWTQQVLLLHQLNSWFYQRYSLYLKYMDDEYGDDDDDDEDGDIKYKMPWNKKITFFVSLCFLSSDI